MIKLTLLTHLFNNSWSEKDLDIMFLQSLKSRWFQSAFVSDFLVEKWARFFKHKLQITLDSSCMIFTLSIKCDQTLFLWVACFLHCNFCFRFRNLASYEVKSHHVWNKPAFITSSCEYKTICLSSDQKRLIEDSSACAVFEINCFVVKSESVSLVSKAVELSVEWVMIVSKIDLEASLMW